MAEQDGIACSRGYEAFSWRGEQIWNIRDWAKERGEPMVKYVATRNTVHGPELYEGEMPECFYNSLVMMNGWMYERI